MKLTRQPRATIRVKDAAAILGISGSSVRELIALEKLRAFKAKPDTTSPWKLFRSEVEQKAREWGVL